MVFDYCSDFYGFRCRYVYQILPFKDYSIRRASEKLKILSFDDFMRFYSCVGSEMMRLLFLVGYFTGMRISEVRGLKVNAIHDSGIEVYQQACDKVGSGRTILMSLKTRSSQRFMLVPSFLYTKICSYISSSGLVRDDFLFPGRDGLLPVGETTINRAIAGGCSAAGLDRFTFHYFRRSEATVLYEKGVSESLIRDYLGHSSFEVTRQYYLHSGKDKEGEVARLLDGKYSGYFK